MEGREAPVTRQFVGRDDELARIHQLYGTVGARGVVITGEPGIGKTCLGREALRTARKHGIETLRAEGTEAGQAIDFGAVAGWLPKIEPHATQTQTLISARTALAAKAEAGRLVVFVDDAHLLDPCSWLLISQLGESGTAFVILSMPGGSFGLGSLGVHQDDYGHLALGRLGLDAVERLVADQLGGPIDSLSLARLNHLSEGNPLFIIDLIGRARATGCFVERYGMWHLEEDPPIAGASEAAIRALLEPMDETGVEVLELLSLEQPLALSFLEDIDSRVLELLEERGVIAVEKSRRRTSVRIVSPLIRAFLRTHLSTSKTRRRARQLAEAFEANPSRRPDDRVRAASWRLEAGRTVEADVLLECARVASANCDYALGEHLARSAADAGGGLESDIELARALALQGRSAEADGLLDALASRATGDADLARVMIARVRDLTHFGGVPERALAIGAEALDRLADPLWHDALAIELSVRAALMGDYAGALDFRARAKNPDGGTGHDDAGALLVAAVGSVMLGRIGDVEDAVQRGLAVSAGTETEPLIPEMFRMHLQHSRLWSGSIHSVESACKAEYENALDNLSVDTLGLWAAHHAISILLRGDTATAASVYANAVGHLSERDPVRALPVTQCWWALALAESGRTDECEGVLAAVEREYLPSEFRVTALRDRARARIMATRLNLRDAAELCLDAGLELIDRSHVTWGVLALHDCVRFGHPEIAVEALARHTDAIEGPLAPLLAAHARSLSTSDGKALDSCAASFRDLGTLQFAAEAARQAVEVHRSAGDHVRAARSAGVARLLSAQCTGIAWTTQFDRSYLTDRELQVAAAAAVGQSNREIAETLFISRRTVENHLSNVYTKLGIGGRAELEVALPMIRSARAAGAKREFAAPWHDEALGRENGSPVRDASSIG